MNRIDKIMNRIFFLCIFTFGILYVSDIYAEGYSNIWSIKIKNELNFPVIVNSNPNDLMTEFHPVKILPKGSRVIEFKTQPSFPHYFAFYIFNSKNKVREEIICWNVMTNNNVFPKNSVPKVLLDGRYGNNYYEYLKQSIEGFDVYQWFVINVQENDNSLTYVKFKDIEGYFGIKVDAELNLSNYSVNKENDLITKKNKINDFRPTVESYSFVFAETTENIFKKIKELSAFLL